MQNRNLTIGELGQLTGTKAETIRYYERIGLLVEPGRTAGNYRTYGPEHLNRLSFVRRSRDLGFSLEQIRVLLDLSDDQDRSCAAIDAIAEDLPFADGSFDGAMATYTVHQWSDLERGIAEMKRVTRPGGAIVILGVADNGPAARSELKSGDVILAVNNQKIARTSDLEKATREPARIWRIVVVRGGQQINVTLGG